LYYNLKLSNSLICISEDQGKENIFELTFIDFNSKQYKIIEYIKI